MVICQDTIYKYKSNKFYAKDRTSANSYVVPLLFYAWIILSEFILFEFNI